jgi:DNA-binding NarL/FixJ family response regulator
VTGPAIRVLCVDDNPDLALLLDRRIALQEDMESVGRVHDLQSLVTTAQRTHPDVVVLDLRMLGLDSLDTMQALHAGCPGARTLIYSGYSSEEPIERAREAGAWGYVFKSDEASELFAAIRRVAAGERAFPPTPG